MQITLTLQRTLTGIFCQWSILMVIFLLRLTTDCGARQDHLTEEVVMVLMLTVTGDSIGAQEGPLFWIKDMSLVKTYQSSN